jgi:transposase
MATKLVVVDRTTPMLLPCDLRDWVAADDLVHFVIEAVEGMDLRGVAVNERGTGGAQYPPGMLLALLIYSYANGVFSSRRIERSTYQQVSVRYLCGETHPDHDTIAAFRARHLELLQQAFTEVLRLPGRSSWCSWGRCTLTGPRS